MIAASLAFATSPASAIDRTDIINVNIASGVTNPDRTLTSSASGTTVGLFAHDDDTTPVNACDLPDSSGTVAQGQPCLITANDADQTQLSFTVRAPGGDAYYYAKITDSPDGFQSPINFLPTKRYAARTEP